MPVSNKRIDATAMINPNSSRIANQELERYNNGAEPLGSAFMVRLGLIKPNPFGLRERFDDDELLELAESIRANGMLEPILVRKVTENQRDIYEVIAGERRRRAAVLLELEKVPIIIRSSNEKESKLLMVAENLQRQDLTPLEEGKIFQEMINLTNISKAELAQTIQKSTWYVNDRLATFGQFLKTGYLAERNPQIVEGIAREVPNSLHNTEDSSVLLRPAQFGSLEPKQIERPKPQTEKPKPLSPRTPKVGEHLKLPEWERVADLAKETLAKIDKLQRAETFADSVQETRSINALDSSYKAIKELRQEIYRKLGRQLPEE